MKILRSQRMHDKYLIGGQDKYIYLKTRSYDNEVYVHCEWQSYGCKATHRIAVRIDFNMIDSTKEEHNHSPVDAHRIDSDETRADIKEILCNKVINRTYEDGDVKKVFETENSKFMEKHNLDAGLNFENLKGNLYKMIKNLKKQLINNN